jgi:hypothetical protein
MMSMFQEYLVVNRPKATWWLQSTPKAEEGDLPRIAALLENKRRAVRLLLEEKRNISPLAGKIADIFTNILVSIYNKGSTVSFTMKVPSPANISAELCIIPAEEVAAKAARGEKFISSVFWNHDWGAVMLFALELPPPVLAGVLLHEFGHGYYDKVLHAPSATAPLGSASHSGEEVLMYELTFLVVNHETGGVYGEACDEVLLRHKNVRTPKRLMQSLTLADLAVLDKAINAEGIGAEAAQIVLAQHISLLGLRFLEKRGKGHDEKVAFYQWIVETTTGKPPRE